MSNEDEKNIFFGQLGLKPISLSSRMSFYVGKYFCTSADKYDDFLAENGISLTIRKIAATTSTDFEVFVEASIITFKTSFRGQLKPIELKFKIKEYGEFIATSIGKSYIKVSVNREGNRFVSVRTAKKEGKKSIEIIREFKGDEMIQTSKCIGTEEIVCTQIFKKQKKSYPGKENLQTPYKKNREKTIDEFEKFKKYRKSYVFYLTRINLQNSESTAMEFDLTLESAEREMKGGHFIYEVFISI